MSKKIKIECPSGIAHATKIFVDGKDLLKMLPIRGIEVEGFVDDVIRLKLHLTAPPIEFIGKAKIIEIFGEEDYCLIDREDIPLLSEIKKSTKSLKLLKKELEDREKKLEKEN